MFNAPPRLGFSSQLPPACSVNANTSLLCASVSIPALSCQLVVHGFWGRFCVLHLYEY